MSTSNTLTDSKSVETLKTHTQAYMVQTIVTHSTIRLNNLKQTDPLECGAEIKFSGSVSGETIHSKNGKMAQNISSNKHLGGDHPTRDLAWVTMMPQKV